MHPTIIDDGDAGTWLECILHSPRLNVREFNGEPIVFVPNKHDAPFFVDAADAERVLAIKWHVNIWRGRHPYAFHRVIRNRVRKDILLHHFVLGVEGGQIVDHINGDPFDNRKRNLRKATPLANLRNSRKRSGCGSRFKGVALIKGAQTNVWRAHISTGQGVQHLGCFATEADAAQAYDAAARAHFGEFAALNFPRAGEQSALRYGDYAPDDHTDRLAGAAATSADSDRGRLAAAASESVEHALGVKQP